MGIIGGVTNTTVGFIFAIYLLMQKEKLFSQIKKVAKAYIPEKKVERISNILTVSNEQFNKFLTGQFIEALILGSLCAIGMFILGLPYAVTIGILIAFTA
ncbi:MAG: AI-2E family transporter, partial [Clostridia bacterium]